MSIPPPEQEAGRQRLFDLAEQNGIGQEFRFVYEQAALRYGMYPRLYRWSIMYAPPANKSRVLICAWVRPRQGKLSIYLAATAFAEFYPVRTQEVVHRLGHNRYSSLGMEDLKIFIRDLDALFTLIEKHRS